MNAPECVELSNREFQVMQLIAQGLSNQEIAKKLTVSNHTVKSYIGRIKVKTEARNRVQIALWYFAHVEKRIG